MKTSAQWWNEVKNSPQLFNDWLVKQYRGEVTAAKRIREVVVKFSPGEKVTRILEEIASQEESHASWVLQLLHNRGITPSTANAENRYWREVLPAAVDLQTTAAIGAHAETMRLERINVIVADPQTPFDVQEVFAKIQKQEIWHAAAFAKIAGEMAMKATKYTEEQGRAVLGLYA